jgi:hypothetical protein
MTYFRNQFFNLILAVYRYFPSQPEAAGIGLSAFQCQPVEEKTDSNIH